MSRLPRQTSQLVSLKNSLPEEALSRLGLNQQLVMPDLEPKVRTEPPPAPPTQKAPLAEKVQPVKPSAEEKTSEEKGTSDAKGDDKVVIEVGGEFDRLCVETEDQYFIGNEGWRSCCPKADLHATAAAIATLCY